jgi:hypothetical protein
LISKPPLILIANDNPKFAMPKKLSEFIYWGDNINIKKTTNYIANKDNVTKIFISKSKSRN